MAGAVTSVRVLELPNERVAGARVLHLTGTIAAIDELGRVAEADTIAEIATALDDRINHDTEQTEPFEFDGVITLAEPITVNAVAPAALFDIDGGVGCVTANGTDHAVTIVGSKLGKTYVTPRHSDAHLPDTVESPVPATRACNAA